MNNLLLPNDCVHWTYDWYMDGGRVHNRATAVYGNKVLCVIIPKGLAWATVSVKEGDGHEEPSLIHASMVRAWVEKNL